jgi:hypothetical protein
MGYCATLPWAMSLPATAAVTGRFTRKTVKRFEIRRVTMWKKSSFVGASIAFAALASASLLAAPAQAAVVYCKTAGVPQGCVVRPTPVVVTPAPVVRPIYYGRPVYGGPVAVRHVGYTRVTPYGVKHVGYTRVWR